jgi:hypothetical protein
MWQLKVWQTAGHLHAQTSVASEYVVVYIFVLLAERRQPGLALLMICEKDCRTRRLQGQFSKNAANLSIGDQWRQVDHLETRLYCPEVEAA